MMTILREKDKDILIKKDNVRELGSKEYKTVRYEWWTNKEKMQQGIPEEVINGEQHIYCKGFSGIEEAALIKLFDAAK
jgi:hypothetical protein